jgi:hypothetical protein
MPSSESLETMPSSAEARGTPPLPTIPETIYSIAAMSSVIKPVLLNGFDKANIDVEYAVHFLFISHP